MRRAVLALTLLTLPFLAQAGKLLPTYQALVKSLDNGDAVRIVVDYGKCKLIIDGKEEPSVNAVGGQSMQAWERFSRGLIGNKEEYIACSETVLIAHPRYKYVQNYVRFRIYESGKVEITARYLKPDTLEILMDETFMGQISNGKDKNAVKFFRP